MKEAYLLPVKCNSVILLNPQTITSSIELQIRYIVFSSEVLYSWYWYFFLISPWKHVGTRRFREETKDLQKLIVTSSLILSCHFTSVCKYTSQSLIGIMSYVSNFAVQMYKFMTEFALLILNIIFRCNSCISVLTNTLCKWTHAPSKSCPTLHSRQNIKIVSFHFQCVKRFSLVPETLKCLEDNSETV